MGQRNIAAIGNCAGPQFHYRAVRIGSTAAAADGTGGSGSTTLSEELDLSGETLVGILLPSTWTTANITFSDVCDPADPVDVYDDTGTELVVTGGAAAKRRFTLHPGKYAGLGIVKLRSGTTALPVVQATAAQTIYAITRPCQ